MANPSGRTFRGSGRFMPQWLLALATGMLLTFGAREALGNVGHEQGSVIKVRTAYYCFSLGSLGSLVLVNELADGLEGKNVFDNSLKVLSSLGKCGVIWGDLFLIDAKGRSFTILSMGNEEVTFTAFDAYSQVLHRFIWVWSDYIVVNDY